MDINYKNKKLHEICTNARKAEKEYGLRMAEKIHLRIDQIKASETIEELIRFQIGRCHALSGERNGQFAMDLVHPMRLIFFVNRFGKIQIAEIIEIVDYH